MLLTEEYEDYEGVKDSSKSKFETRSFTLRKDKDGKVMGKEYGFRIKGPEPTRYGDWEVKGRCSDF